MSGSELHDHERFLLLAAKRIREPLTREEEADLEAHLSACPSCRTIAAGMRRDDIRLRAALTPVPVSPRVRERVMAEASGSGRRMTRMMPLLAAAIALALVGLPLVTGALREPAGSAPPPSDAVVSPSPSVAQSPSVEPTPSVAPSPSVETPPVSPSTTVPPGSGPFVNGNYKYGIRTDAVAARLVDGSPVGEWWRETTVRGRLERYAGPITCLIIRGKDAWLAGPATSATDGRDDLAMFFRLHDGGPSGNGDQAIGYLSNPGQTLTTMTQWCETRYTPAGPFDITSGDVVVRAEGS